jgi:hypothetical protein
VERESIDRLRQVTMGREHRSSLTVRRHLSNRRARPIIR